MRHLTAFIMMLSVSTGAHARMPDETPTQAFTAQIRPLLEAERTARIAGICQLRSEGWYRNISAGIMMGVQQIEDKWNIPQSTAQAIITQVSRESFQNSPSCRSLFNAPVLRRLDAMEDEATGGYR